MLDTGRHWRGAPAGRLGLPRFAGLVDRGYSDVGFDADCDSGEFERLLQVGEDPGGYVSARRQAAVADEHAELVATQAGHRVAGSQQRREACRDLDQQVIPVLVPHGVVDVLEPVDVEHQDHRVGVAAARGGQQLGGAIVEQCPIRQTRETIVEALVFDGSLVFSGDQPQCAE